MRANELDQYKKVFFIGIGGISMSGLAEVLNQDGKSVYGSDQNLSDITKHLEALGTTVYKGHDANHISEDFDLVVYTAAIMEDIPELKKA